MLLELYEGYSRLLKYGDSRTKGWLLVDSPLPILGCTLMYLYIVRIGPKLMQKRKAFQLNWLLIPYNLFLSALNFYISLEIFIASRRLGYNYICEPSREEYSLDELQIVNIMWWYYFSKLIEFCETFFYILRKKKQQLTFLHVYHHSTMPSYTWILIKFTPTGSTSVCCMLNSCVHVSMYFYYGLSAAHLTRFIWWKKYVTILQLVQFVVVLLGNLNALINCDDFPIWIKYLTIIYMLSFMVLFGNFYVKTYMEKGNHLFLGNTGMNPKSGTQETLNYNESSTDRNKKL